MNTPYLHSQHFHLLKVAAPSIRQVPANAFGDSGSNAHWFECDVKSNESEALDAKLADLGIYAGTDTGYQGRSCRKLCKYKMDESLIPKIDKSRARARP